jgi:hypothetical protein
MACMRLALVFTQDHAGFNRFLPQPLAQILYTCHFHPPSKSMGPAMLLQNVTLATADFRVDKWWCVGKNQLIGVPCLLLRDVHCNSPCCCLLHINGAALYIQTCLPPHLCSSSTLLRVLPRTQLGEGERSHKYHNNTANQRDRQTEMGKRKEKAPLKALLAGTVQG